jgi:hypothetical protein
MANAVIGIIATVDFDFDETQLAEIAEQLQKRLRNRGSSV